MLKILFLAAIYNLTDKQAAYLIRDRISFRHFLGYPDELPDEKTIWVFRDRLANTHLDKKFQGEIVDQIQNHRFKIRNGIAQDTTFITSKSSFDNPSPGHFFPTDKFFEKENRLAVLENFTSKKRVCSSK